MEWRQRSRGRLGRVALGVLLAGGLTAGPARAELFRCERPDGTIAWTDSQNGCVHSVRHEPTGDVQTHAAPRPPARSRAASRGAPAALGSDAGAEAHWRQLKRDKQAELALLEARRDEISTYVVHCNRGGEVFMRDPQTGIKHTLSCSRVRSEQRALEARAASLRDYLERGIREECRRAGCLPGWLR